MTGPAIVTVGHSTLPAEDFARLLRDNNVSTLLDVRSHPTSKHEQYRRENMATWLPKHKIAYIWEPRLGGWDVRHAPLAEELKEVNVDLGPYLRGYFPKQQIADVMDEDTGKPTWYVRGFFEYQFFMRLPEFEAGIDELKRLATQGRVATCCGELLPWACHRSMISDRLWFEGIDSAHLQPKWKLHSLVIGNRLERYEQSVLDCWQRATSGGCGCTTGI